MRISIGSDHRGVQLKSDLVAALQAAGNEVSDEGTFQAESMDYPDIAEVVGDKVSKGEAERGILICATGVGMSIAANKIAGVRAAVIQDPEVAKLSRQHNNLNVLCLPGDVLSKEDAASLVNTWLTTEFEGGRHARRLEKITKIESHQQ